MTRQPVRPATRPAKLALAAVTVLLLASLGLLVTGPAAARAQDKKPAAGGAAQPPATNAGKVAAAGKRKNHKKATAPSAAADDKFIVPYIGDNTFIVARLDVARLDVAALEQFVGGATEEAARTLQIATGGDGREEALDMGAGMTRVRDRLARFTKAGGRHAYLLVDGDLWSPETVLVVPIRKGANVKAMTEVLTELNEGTTDAVDQVGGALLSTSRSKIISINARHNAAAAGGGTRGEAADRPDLPAAFAAAGDAPLRVSLVPGASFRHAVGGGLHSLPDGWGGGDPMILARGTRWVTLAVHQKPAARLALTVQASNEESATKLAEMATAGIARLKADAEADEGTKAHRAKHLGAVKVERQGVTVTMTLAGDYFQRGVPEPILMAIRTRFRLIGSEDDGDDDFRGRGAQARPPGGAQPAPPPAASQPPKPPTPPAPPEEGDGLD